MPWVRIPLGTPNFNDYPDRAAAAMLPANIKASLENLTLRGKPPAPLWTRVPMQALFVALLHWTALAR
jgi:uncharacterized membrane protein